MSFNSVKIDQTTQWFVIVTMRVEVLGTDVFLPVKQACPTSLYLTLCSEYFVTGRNFPFAKKPITEIIMYWIVVMAIVLVLINFNGLWWYLLGMCWRLSVGCYLADGNQGKAQHTTLPKKCVMVLILNSNWFIMVFIMETIGLISFT